MKKLGIILVFASLVGAAGWAQGTKNIEGTGQRLHLRWLEYQKQARDDRSALLWESGMFMGFVSGVSAVLEGTQTISPPADITLGQKCAVVGRYLEAHPEEWNKHEAIIVLKALLEAWPPKQ